MLKLLVQFKKGCDTMAEPPSSLDLMDDCLSGLYSSQTRPSRRVRNATAKAAEAAQCAESSPPDLVAAPSPAARSVTFKPPPPRGPPPPWAGAKPPPPKGPPPKAEPGPKASPRRPGAAAAAAEDAERGYDLSMSDAVTHMANGEYGSAIEACEDALEASPRDAEAALTVALARMMRNDDGEDDVDGCTLWLKRCDRWRVDGRDALGSKWHDRALADLPPARLAAHEPWREARRCLLCKERP